MKLLLFIRRWQCCSFQWIRRHKHLISFFSFNFFTNILIIFVILYDFFIHIWRIPVPSISFYLPVHLDFFDQIIRSYTFIGKLSSCLPWSFSALLSIMSHSTAIFAGSFSIIGCLHSFLSSIVPILDKSFRIMCWYFDQFSSSFGILCIPRKLFYILGSVLLFLHHLL